MSLDSLREWLSSGGVRRAEHQRFTLSYRRITWENAHKLAERRPGSRPERQAVINVLHAEAIEECASRARAALRKEPDYGAEMKLPEGKTCGDCWHVKRCRAFGFTSSEANTGCDFHPRRFADAGFPDDGWRQSALSVMRERFAA